MPLNPGLGLESRFAINVRLGWKTLVANLETLAMLVLGAKDLVSQLSSVTEVELQNLDYLNAPTCPEDWGMEGTFNGLCQRDQ
jgi:hypothetical protein